MASPKAAKVRSTSPRKSKRCSRKEKSNYHPLYDLKAPIKTKIETICKEIYRAGNVVYTDKAFAQIEQYEKLGFSDAYICMAKTPQSLTDDPLSPRSASVASPSRSGK
jgi:formate--tetrahydrofolate ligase